MVCVWRGGGVSGEEEGESGLGAARSPQKYLGRCQHASAPPPPPTHTHLDKAGRVVDALGQAVAADYDVARHGHAGLLEDRVHQAPVLQRVLCVVGCVWGGGLLGVCVGWGCVGVRVEGGVAL